MQISSINDKNIVFLDIKFPDYPRVADMFLTLFKQWTENRGLPMTERASFGFIQSNFTVINKNSFRLNPGLENEEMLKKYAEVLGFFKR